MTCLKLFRCLVIKTNVFYPIFINDKIKYKKTIILLYFLVMKNFLLMIGNVIKSYIFIY